MNCHVWRTTFAAMLAVLATISTASSAFGMSSISWSPPVDLGSARAVSDVAYAGDALAVAWVQWGRHRPTKVGVRTSTDAGKTFSSTVRFSDADTPAVAICGTTVALVFVNWLSDTESELDLATRPLSGGTFTLSTIVGGPGLRDDPDIACSAGRMFVGWLEQVSGDSMRLLVANALISDRAFGSATNLGPTDRYYPSGLALAAASNFAYVAFTRADGVLRLKRWRIGAGPGYAVTPKPVEVVGGGTRHHASEYPVIDADGTTVLVAWTKCSGTLARVSTDRASTWGPVREIAFDGCRGVSDGGVGPDNVAIAGKAMLITMTSEGPCDCASSVLVRSTNAFVNRTLDELGPHASEMVGYVGEGAASRLADVFARSDQIRFRLQN